jgi:hypothetical protein
MKQIVADFFWIYLEKSAEICGNLRHLRSYFNLSITSGFGSGHADQGQGQ